MISSTRKLKARHLLAFFIASTPPQLSASAPQVYGYEKSTLPTAHARNEIAKMSSSSTLTAHSSMLTGDYREFNRKEINAAAALIGNTYLRFSQKLSISTNSEELSSPITMFSDNFDHIKTKHTQTSLKPLNSTANELNLGVQYRF